MSQYKMLIADIDGTTVDHGSTGTELSVDHPACQAVQAAQAAGKVVTFATGRNYPKAASVIKGFNIQSLVIVNSGSQIVEAQTGKPVWEMRIPYEPALAIAKFVIQGPAYADATMGFGYLPEHEINEITDAVLADIIYLDIIGLNAGQDLDALVAHIATFDGVTSGAVPSPQVPGKMNVIVTNKNATKEHALVELQKLLGITKDETIAIGDAANDLPLFRASGLKIAVDNASDALKQAADLVVPSVHEHGLVEAIQTKLL